MCKQLGFNGALAFMETSIIYAKYSFVMSHTECIPELWYVDKIPGFPPERIQDCSYHSSNVTCSKGIAGVVCQCNLLNLNIIVYELCAMKISFSYQKS